MALLAGACGNRAPQAARTRPKPGVARRAPGPVTGQPSEPTAGTGPAPSAPAGPASPARRAALDAITFAGVRDGWAGGDGVILRTTDGGSRWTVVDRPQATVTQLDFPTTGSGFAVTRRGLLRTTDGGRAWTAAVEPSGRRDCRAALSVPCILSVSFPTPSTGYAVGAVSSQVGTRPQGIAVSPGGRLLLVANGSGTLSIYDLARRRIAASVPVGAVPTSVAVGGGLAYVANQNSDTVSVVDLGTDRVVHTVKTAPNPCALRLGPDGRRLYVVGDGATSTLEVVDTRTLRIAARIDVGGGACALAVGPDGRRVYVASDFSHRVYVVDTATDSVSARLAIGRSPSAVALSPSGARLYVAGALDRRVWAVDTATGEAVGSVDVAPLVRGLAVAPDGRALYVAASSGRVAVIDTRSLKVVRRVAVGAGARQIAVAPSGDVIYVSGGSDRLVRIDARTGGTKRLAATGVPVRDGTGRPVPQAGTLYRTTDGGRHWQALPTPAPVQSACFTGPRDGWAAAGPRVWRTSDGGRDWRAVFTAPLRASAGATTDIRCRGSRAWILILGRGAAMEHAPYIAFGSGARGRRWRPLIEENYTHMGTRGVDAPEGPGSYPGPFAVTPGGLPVFAGAQPVFGSFGLQVGGARSRVVPGAALISALNFAGPGSGWVLAGSGRFAGDILHTTDGGRHWALQWPPHGKRPLRGISFLDAQTGFGLATMGAEDAVLKTQDGGATWRQIATLPAGSYRPYPASRAIVFTSAQDGFAVNEHGTLLDTADGGRTWTRVASAPAAGVSAIAFVSATDGCLVVRQRARLQATTDGGRTWIAAGYGRPRPGPLGCAMQLAANRWASVAAKLRGSYGAFAAFAAFVPARTAWATDPRNLLRTTDGGAHWTKLALPAPLAAGSAELDFVDPEHGFMLTAQGRLYATADGGGHWARRD